MTAGSSQSAGESPFGTLADLLSTFPFTNELPGLVFVGVPQAWCDHPLIRSQFFYTLPLRLVKLIQQHLDVAKFDSKLLKMEIELATITGDHESRVGFKDGAAIAFNYFSKFRLDGAAEEAIRKHTTDETPNNIIRRLNASGASAQRSMQAYAGWLLTNPTFLTEHSALLKAGAEFLQSGSWPIRIPAIPPILPLPKELGANRRSTPGTIAATGLFDRFCSRWRLSELRAPLLPIPIGVQAPAMLPQLAAQHATASQYGMFAIPDTMPLPRENELRSMVEQAIRTVNPEHLREWSKLIDTSNVGKKALDRFARVFPLQHYYRVLHSRHRDALHRQLGRLRRALSEYFHTSEDSVRRDLELIEKRLGKGWWNRFPLPAVCTG